MRSNCLAIVLITLTSTHAFICSVKLNQQSPNVVFRYNISSVSVAMTIYPLIGVATVTWPVRFTVRRYASAVYAVIVC